MALTVTHPFVSAIPDDPAAVAAGEVVPTNWNAGHTISGTVDVANGGTGATTATGTAGSNVLSNSPTIVTPAITGPVTVTNTTADVPGLIVTGNSDTLPSGGGVAAFRVNTTWDNGGSEWGRGIELNVTNTGSANNSFLIGCNVGGANAFSVRTSGSAASAIEFSSQTGSLSFFSSVDRLLFGTSNATRWTMSAADGSLEAWTTAYIGTGATTVSGLGTATAGRRWFVTDSTVVAAGNFGAIVAGTGANSVPVYADGANWRIG